MGSPLANPSEKVLPKSARKAALDSLANQVVNTF